jgi:hypothetical protein
MYDFEYTRGQSIVELIVAMAIFALVSSSLATLSIGGFSALGDGGVRTEATALAMEGVSAVRAIRTRAWNENIYNTSAVSVLGGEWVFDGEGTTEIIGIFTRTISFQDICRDISKAIVSCPGSYVDPHIRLAVVEVDWQTRPGVTSSVQQSTYVTNWDSTDWVQTDWSGGSGQSIWSDASMFDTKDSSIAVGAVGQISLESLSAVSLISDSDFEGSADTSYTWPFSVSGNYTFDSAKIEVTSGVARLIATGGSSSSGDTLNSTFDTNSSNWTFGTWDSGGGEVTPTGAWQSTGGDGGGYVNIDIPSNAKNDKVGGYWEQAITVTENGAQVTCSFDWRVSQWVAGNGVDAYKIYVFLDGATGEPSIGTEVWASANQGGTSAWSGTQDIDCSAFAPTSGTYYYKVAVWLDAKNKDTGPITAGFDNAKVHWEKTTGGSYPTDSPSITPTSSYSSPGVISWDSFAETAVKNGGEIYYQLSDDDGVTWQYWNGSIWAFATLPSEANTASTINSEIGSFDTSAGSILFRAYLESDGSQFVQLDDVTIGFTPASSAWAYNTWDVGGGEVTPTGTRFVNGGNPNGYFSIDIPSNARNDTVGGYLEQTVTVSSPGLVLSCNLDWLVSNWVAGNGVNDNQVYVFLDNTNGAPTIGNEIWSSGTLSGTSAWASEIVDCSSSAPAVGTYYYKIAFWLDAKNSNTGPITAGFDNVEINTGSYDTSGTLLSSAFDMGDSSPLQLIEWDETVPVCSPACSVQFELSTAPDSGGSPGAWSAWYGEGGIGTFFTSASGALAPTALNGNQWMRYRATLTGDGDTTPTLSEVRVNYK